MLQSLLLASISLLSAVVAQTGARIAFNSVPAVVKAGETYNITWGGGNGSPVTLTLRKGNPSNLDTIGTIADKVAGSFFEWMVSKDLVTASDYALQITQGQDDINYSGPFSLSGGIGPSSIAYPSSTSSMSSESATQTSTEASSGVGNSTTFSVTAESTEGITWSNASTITETGGSGTRTGKPPGSPASETSAPTFAPNAGSVAYPLGAPALLAMVVAGAGLYLS